MVRKRRVFIAMFLALAVMLQYSFAPQTFMSYAGEEPEVSTTEESVSAAADPAPAVSDPAPAASEPAPAVSEPAPAASDPAPAPAESAPAATDPAPAVSEPAPASAAESGTAAAKAAGDTKSDNTVSAKAQPAAVKAAEPSTSAKTAANEATLHITNILYTKHSAVNGHAVAYEDTFTLVKGQTKGSAAFLNKVGGKNVTAGGLGYTYKLLNEFVLTDKDGAPIYHDSTSGLLTVKKVGYKSDGSAIVVTFSDGTTQEINENDVYISPVYKATANWYLNYNYIDRISTGSGSWSNKDAVVEFSHTYSDPSVKTPVDDYAFRYWQNDETEDVYYAGETHTYNGAEQPKGSTKEVNIYAYWQPAVAVVYNVLGVTEKVSNVEGKSITVYEKTAESTVEGVTFDGWYDADGNRLSDEMVYAAPEITKDNNTAVSYNVFARFATSRSVQKVWDDADNADKIRTDSVTVQLYANGEPTGKTIVLSNENSWADAFANLDAYDKDGNLIEYTISEEAIPAGYSASISVDGTSFTVTNTHTPAPAPAGGGTDPDPSDNDKTVPPAAGGGNGGVTTAATGGAMGPAAITANPTPTAPATTAISDPETPLAVNAYWALVNLLCAIATALLSIIMLIRYFGRRSEEDETIGEEVDVQRKGKLRIASIIPAIGAIIAFILTEDMSLPMAMTDKWTVLMIAILVVQALVAIIANIRSSEEGDTEAATA